MNLAWEFVFSQKMTFFHETKTVYWQHKLGSNFFGSNFSYAQIRSRRKFRRPWTPPLFLIYVLNPLRLTIGTNESIRSSGRPMQVKQVTCLKKIKENFLLFNHSIDQIKFSLFPSPSVCVVDGQLRRQDRMVTGTKEQITLEVWAGRKVRGQKSKWRSRDSDNWVKAHANTGSEVEWQGEGAARAGWAQGAPQEGCLCSGSCSSAQLHFLPFQPGENRSFLNSAWSPCRCWKLKAAGRWK